MNDKQKLLQKIRSVDFAMWELHIFLDTHPNDTDALSLYNKYQKKHDDLAAQYESIYGPLDMRNVTTDNRWQWINDPWPWEVSKEGD
jgi:spore coat protein JB